MQVGCCLVQLECEVIKMIKILLLLALIIVVCFGVAGAVGAIVNAGIKLCEKFTKKRIILF